MVRIREGVLERVQAPEGDFSLDASAASGWRREAMNCGSGICICGPGSSSLANVIPQSTINQRSGRRMKLRLLGSTWQRVVGDEEVKG